MGGLFDLALRAPTPFTISTRGTTAWGMSKTEVWLICMLSRSSRVASLTMDDTMSPEKIITRYRIVSAAAFLSGLVALDLFFSFFCASFPLLFYLIAGALGASRGPYFHARFSGDNRAARFVRGAGICLALFSVTGIIVQCVRPVNWNTKCSWRYCGRAMSPGLLKSPFPVGTPTCRGWWTCANEYPFTPDEYQSALRRIEKQGCPAP